MKRTIIVQRRSVAAPVRRTAAPRLWLAPTTASPARPRTCRSFHSSVVRGSDRPSAVAARAVPRTANSRCGAYTGVLACRRIAVRQFVCSLAVHYPRRTSRPRSVFDYFASVRFRFVHCHTSPHIVQHVSFTGA